MNDIRVDGARERCMDYAGDAPTYSATVITNGSASRIIDAYTVSAVAITINNGGIDMLVFVSVIWMMTTTVKMTKGQLGPRRDCVAMATLDCFRWLASWTRHAMSSRSRTTATFARSSMPRHTLNAPGSG